MVVSSYPFLPPVSSGLSRVCLVMPCLANKAGDHLHAHGDGPISDVSHALPLEKIGIWVIYTLYIMPPPPPLEGGGFGKRFHPP